MKYRIIYLTEFDNSAVFLVGYDKHGKILYRRYTTATPKLMDGASRALLASLFTSLNPRNQVA